MQVQGDVAIGTHFDQCVDKGVKFQTGLVLGQVVADRAYLFGVVQTPKLDGKEQATSLTPRLSAWMNEHARQLQRLICGGISIVGAYIVSSPNEMQALQSSGSLTDLMSGLPGGPPSGDRLLLKCPMNKKIVCEHFKPEEVRVAECCWPCDALSTADRVCISRKSLALPPLPLHSANRKW